MLLTLALPAILCLTAPNAPTVPPGSHWKIGTPIATYFAGPPITDQTAKQMRDGGFNVIWCKENELDTAHKYGLRAMLHSELLVPATLDDKAKLAELDALVERVKGHKAMYAYFITDEPTAAAFEGLGRLVAHLREKDPAHLAYINLFPTYATNEQLGTQGDVTTAYREHLRRFVQTVKPALLSYDHYHFTVNGDTDQYFLNLGLIREAAQAAGIPFLNIVQACTWSSGMRAPNADEMRWLNSTSLAYGAQGLSYFVYFHKPFFDEFGDKAGQMMRPDGTTTPLYDAGKTQLPEFVAVASQLKGQTSLGTYFVGAVPLGGTPPPDQAPFTIGSPEAREVRVLVGVFGKPGRPTHAFVVNLDYRRGLGVTVNGPGKLEVFDPAKRKWSKAVGIQTNLSLLPGGGALVRVKN